MEDAQHLVWGGFGLAIGGAVAAIINAFSKYQSDQRKADRDGAKQEGDLALEVYRQVVTELRTQLTALQTDVKGLHETHTTAMGRLNEQNRAAIGELHGQHLECERRAAVMASEIAALQQSDADCRQRCEQLTERLDFLEQQQREE